MRQESIVPVTATSEKSRIALTDKDGDVWFVVMPSPDGAVFYATGLQLEFTRAKRTPSN